VGAALVAIGVFAVAAPEAREIERLVQQLGSGKFAEREAAQKALETIGPAALEALKKAASSDDAEVSRRANELIPLLERRAETEEAIRPKTVSLAIKDLTVPEAVKELQRVTGLPVKLAGDVQVLADRRVTFDLANVGVWEALDRFCIAANLMQELAEETPAGRPRQTQNFQGGNVNVIEYIGAAPARNRIIKLQAGKPASCPTAYVGALRIRAVPAASGDKTPAGGEGEVKLEIVAEPGLYLRSTPKVRIDQAKDDKGQVATQLAPEERTAEAGQEIIIQQARGRGQIVVQRAIIANGNNVILEELGAASGRGEWAHTQNVRFKLPDEPGQTLKLLKGVLHGQVTMPPQPLVTVDDPLEAAKKDNRLFKGKGLELKLVSATKQDNGTVRLSVELSGMNAAALAFGAQIQAVPNVRGQLGVDLGFGDGQQLQLLDAEGKPYRLTGSQSAMQVNNGLAAQQYSFTFAPPTEKSEPKKLVCVGSRQASVEVPFELKDVSMARGK
jgi:hypothetical protein